MWCVCVCVGGGGGGIPEFELCPTVLQVWVCSVQEAREDEAGHFLEAF